MDQPLTSKKEVEDAEAPAMASSPEEEEPPEAFISSHHEEEPDNCVTVAQLPPSYYHHHVPSYSKPKPYLDPLASSSAKGKKPLETTPKSSKIMRGQLGYLPENAKSDCRRMSLSHTQSRGFSNDVSPSGEARSNALLRAEELNSSLGHDFPSFVKSLVRSHVASCFWLGLPAQFCRDHLPDKDTNITLEDESGKLSVIKFIAYKTGLSAGWRQFSARHNLLEGDVLVFQLVGHAKFKVYIIRANNFNEVDGTLALLNRDSPTKQIRADIEENAFNISKRKRPKSLPWAALPKKNKDMDFPRSVAHHGRIPGEPSEYESEEVGSEVLGEFKLSPPSIQFKNVENFEDFKIEVDGMCIDAKLPKDIRHKYYNLCCCQNAFLHEKVLPGINRRLISGCISETVNISDAIRASKFTTSKDEFVNWDKTLVAFEILGMNVGFLRKRLHRLVSLAFESEGAKDTRRYVEAKIQQAEAHNEIRNIEVRLETLKQASRRSSIDIESLKSIAERSRLFVDMHKGREANKTRTKQSRRFSQSALPLRKEKQNKLQPATLNMATSIGHQHKRI